MPHYLNEQLEDFKKATGRPFKIGLVNLGGTITCIRNEKGLLTPIKDQKELHKIIFNGGLEELKDLIDISVIYHAPIDSSQMTDDDREKILNPLEDNYPFVDGFIVLHGTDTATQTARFLHCTIPYYDPIKFFKQDSRERNWTKPILIVSSQEPAIKKKGNAYTPMPGSDGDLNLVTALSVLIDKQIGEVGILTNGFEAIHAKCSYKGTESKMPLFRAEGENSPTAIRTAFSVVYPRGDYLKRSEQEKIPTVIHNSNKFRGSVETVSEYSHLGLIVAYFQAKEAGKEDIAKFLKEKLPKVVLYSAKGAGNVESHDYEILKKLQEIGVHVFRVPLPGGRIPKNTPYDVPGDDITGLNIDARTAEYKAQSILALMDSLKIDSENQSEFFNQLMEFEFGTEML